MGTGGEEETTTLSMRPGDEAGLDHAHVVANIGRVDRCSKILLSDRFEPPKRLAELKRVRPAGRVPQRTRSRLLRAPSPGAWARRRDLRGPEKVE